TGHGSSRSREAHEAHEVFWLKPSRFFVSFVLRDKPYVQTIALALVALSTMAHVGSPDTFFVGTAGAYPVRVIVRLPGVIPGRAQVTVRVTDDAAARSVSRLTVRGGQ